MSRYYSPLEISKILPFPIPVKKLVLGSYVKFLTTLWCTESLFTHSLHFEDSLLFLPLDCFLSVPNCGNSHACVLGSYCFTTSTPDVTTIRLSIATAWARLFLIGCEQNKSQAVKGEATRVVFFMQT